jgi:hypothetical protein
MDDTSRPGGTPDPSVDQRRDSIDRPVMAGVVVREEDIEPVKGIRAVAILFRGMAILLLILTVLQVAAGVTSAVPLSPGVLFAEAVRLSSSPACCGAPVISRCSGSSRTTTSALRASCWPAWPT